MSALTSVAQGVPTTILLTLLGFVLGALGGIPLALGRGSHIPALRWSARFLIEVLRGIPTLAWLFIIYFGVGSGLIPMDAFTAAVLGFGVVSAAYMAEIYRGGLSAIHPGQWEASDALGMTRAATWARIAGPQVLRVSIPASATFAIGLLKDSSMASVIGVQDIMYFANHDSVVTRSAMAPFLVAAGFYVALTIPCAWATRSLDATLRRRVAR
ncbi:amino acid ABC transporter permease [Nocardioides sp. AN3]